MLWKIGITLLSLGLVAPIGVSRAAESAESTGTLAISILKWEGEYGTDAANGGPMTPTSSEIFTLRENGEKLTRITDLGGVTTYPRFNPQGDWLYFQSNASGLYQVYRCRPDGKEVTNLSSLHQLGDKWNRAFGCALSGDGKKAVYSVQCGEPTGRIVVCNADGSDAQWVMPDLGYIYMAALDQTGARVAFSGPARDYRLSLAERPFTAAQLLTPNHPDSYVPQFTADGKSLIFLRIDGDLYSLDLASQSVRRLTTGNNNVEFRLSKKDLHGSTDGPHLSRDGKHVAYIAKKEGVPQLCVMNVDGSEQRQVTHRDSPCGRPRWSPDGSRIAFVSFEGRYPQLFIISATGGAPKQITNVEGAVNWIDWRPES